MAVSWEWGAGHRASWHRSLPPDPPTARYRPGRGIFGGTFDPPHTGHLILAELARSLLRLSEVVFIPAAHPPHKMDEEFAEATHRLEMTRRAIAGNERFSLSTIEQGHDGPSYTVETLRQLRQEWGETVDIYFIIGADSLVDFPTWYKPAEILDMCRLAVVRRPGVEIDFEALERQLPGIEDRTYFVPAPLIEISSTKVRERVAAGRSIRYLVPRAVEEYINQHGLYQPAARTEQSHAVRATAPG